MIKRQLDGVFQQKKRNCSITPGNSAWIAERAGFRRYDFVDNAQHSSHSDESRNPDVFLRCSTAQCY